MRNTPNLVDAMNGLPPTTLLGVPIRWVCPSSQGYSGILGINGNCGLLSLPRAFNDMFWQNRAFHVEITGAGTGLQSQQNLVSLLPMLNQAATGDCRRGRQLLGFGVRNDTSPTNHNGGATLSLSNSILTSLAGGYAGNGNRAPSSSPVNAQYCNGSRVPPENGGHGYLSPPGRSETTGLSPLFVFNNITPAATVDEGNNWINLSYGPLALFNNAGAVDGGRRVERSDRRCVLNRRRFQCGQRGHQQRVHRRWISSGIPAGGTRQCRRYRRGGVPARQRQRTGRGLGEPPRRWLSARWRQGPPVTRDLTLANNGGAAFTVTSIG